MNKKSWDDLSLDYDKSVEENKDPVIAGYLQREMHIVGGLCKKVIGKNNIRCSVVDMGSGTGRVIFSLGEILKDESISFFGVDNSSHMIKRANEKRLKHYLENQNITFLTHDLTDPELHSLFEPDTTYIVMCLYNTFGVIPPENRDIFVDNMCHLAGKTGLVIISVFNGDDFGFVAPKLYMPMKKMVKQIDDDSFDENNRVFQNKLGYSSQWFTKEEMSAFLKSKIRPIPIDVSVDGISRTLGHVFINRMP